MNTKQMKKAFLDTMAEFQEQIFDSFMKKIENLPEEQPKKSKSKPEKKKEEKPKLEKKEDISSTSKAPRKVGSKTGSKTTAQTDKKPASSTYLEKIQKMLSSARAKAIKTGAWYNVCTEKVHAKSPAMIKNYVFYSCEEENIFIAGEEDSEQLQAALLELNEKDFAMEKVETVTKKKAPPKKDDKEEKKKPSKKEDKKSKKKEKKDDDKDKKKQKEKLPKPGKVVLKPDKDGHFRTEEGFVLDPKCDPPAIIGADPEKTGKIRPLTKQELDIAKKKKYNVMSNLTEQEREEVVRESIIDVGEGQEINMDEEETDDDENIIDDLLESSILQAKTMKKNMEEESQKEKHAAKKIAKEIEQGEKEEKELDEEENEEEKEDFIALLKASELGESIIPIKKETATMLEKKSGLTKERVEFFITNYTEMCDKYETERASIKLKRQMKRK